MSDRIAYEDVVKMALLYNYVVTGNLMLSKKKINKFYQILDFQLDLMNSNIKYIHDIDDNYFIFYKVYTDEEEEYYILKYDIDLKKEYRKLGKYPIDILLASRNSNVLRTLNLKEDENNNLIKCGKSKGLY